VEEGCYALGRRLERVRGMQKRGGKYFVDVIELLDALGFCKGLEG